MVATAGIEAGRKALLVERDALDRLAESLDSRFDHAIDTILGAAGRVVVSGIGKSGLVARKIAATLASTGTAALFVHPAEASHGDLGMIHRQDVVVALSNSGNTAELGDVIAYTRRFAIPLIGITSRSPSTLADQSDVVLLLPPAAEACPTGLAPTTSTTMMMALGDALAIALMTRRGFSSDDFRVLHPGGAIGNKLIRVQDIMHAEAELPLVAPDTRMDEAILEMSRVGFGCVGVVDSDRRLVGVVTDGDLRRHMSDGLLGQTAGAVMTPGPRTIRPAALAAEALGLMNRYKVTNLFVTAEGRPVGILRVHDCLRAGLS
ncbi:MULTISPECIES: KpsF/GutQ family sugar-phosphate isomerase [Inquilinus]|jgi:arabinose-5-phosphate isomerase|uniref:Arabinose-5-phosphate isomerase n=1 Tax=Inquilinus ginsengisoli TaxID=363840 RepID=A0ABU1JM58_9PROT|nr:KpsF/GutQ family sugar-phosphate isomerase [Inquilinus ginsengisoli]MDR6289685.1 arabinose-5-phosphate isomerase [Inquilinus ginsengisoli]